MLQFTEISPTVLEQVTGILRHHIVAPCLLQTDRINRCLDDDCPSHYTSQSFYIIILDGMPIQRGGVALGSRQQPGNEIMGLPILNGYHLEANVPRWTVRQSVKRSAHLIPIFCGHLGKEGDIRVLPCGNVCQNQLSMVKHAVHCTGLICMAVTHYIILPSQVLR